MKETRKHRICTVWLNAYKYLENANLSIETESKSTVAREKGSSKGQNGRLWAQGNSLEWWTLIILIVGMVSEVYTFVKTDQIVQFKYVQFMICH